MAQILWPWKVEGEFSHGVRMVVGGDNEQECVERLADMEDKFGELVWYSGVCDENYVGGEYIGSENIIRTEHTMSESEGV